MNLIIIDGITLPAPSTYEVTYKDIDGEKTQVEDGTTFIERVRSDIPIIKVGWTNLTEVQATLITNLTANAIVSVEYFYGELKSAEMTVSDRALKLKHIETSNKTYWDLSFSLEG